MIDTALTTDMPWVRYLNLRIRRGIQYVMLLYFFQFLLPSYIYGMYHYSEEDMAFSDYFQSISRWFEYLALFPGVFVVLAARFIVVPLAFALVALLWIGWDNL